ncbi:PhoQ sensor [Fragilaria crotonensis]|nr:PhoQ sensor [Fragilaria crotonensis]
MLAHEQYLWLNYASNQFEFDVTKIRSETYVAENVAELITAKLRALPETAQNALRVGACLGAHCELDVIAAIVEMTFAETKFCLRGAVKERLIEMNEIDSFKWAHDKVQQAAYELLPDLIEASCVSFESWEGSEAVG